MSEISKIIDEIVKSELAPLLKQHSFKKRSRTFHREHSNRTDVVNIQASQWNQGNEGKFTVNVGTYFPVIADLAEAPTFKGQPKEYDCTIRERIGYISENKKDTWWELNSESNQDAIAIELATYVELKCLPWLELMSDLDNVKAAAVKKNDCFVAACISLHLGEIAEAKHYLELSFKHQPPAKPRFKAWGEKRGLI